MKSTLFVRPNLKLFALGALVLVALQQLIKPADGDDGTLLLTTEMSARPLEDADLDNLVHRVLENPSYDNYLLISDCYRKRGDTRKAMHYLRKAGLAAKLEDEERF